MRDKISHFLGGILLVTGTTVGAGMLALPVTTAFMGFFPSLLLFILCWLLMLLTAFFFLDVNLSLPGTVNLISMASQTLGRWGKWLCWITYLLLLYSLVAAYIAASAPLFSDFFHLVFGLSIPSRAAYFCLPLLFGSSVYIGTKGVDLLNRVLIIGLAISYVWMISNTIPRVTPELLMHVDTTPFLLGTLVVIFSFGYHIIIPSLTTYLFHNKFHLRLTLIIGSLIPLLIYILWQLVTLGIIPITGDHSFTSAYLSGTTAAGPLSYYIKEPLLQVMISLFTFFAIVTSFIGISLALSDFLKDGFTLSTSWEGRLIACLLTFIPPILFLFTYERGFIVALEYAGVLVAILLIFLPAAMAYTLKNHHFYGSLFGKIVLIGVMVVSLAIASLVVLERYGIMNRTIRSYVQASH